MRSATNNGPSARAAPSVKITNSSPPRRPTVSPARSMRDEAIRHRAQELVPRLVTQRVVGVLEVVEIDEAQGHRTLLAPGPQQHLLGPVDRQLSVGQAGERIVQGLVGQ